VELRVPGAIAARAASIIVSASGAGLASSAAAAGAPDHVTVDRSSPSSWKNVRSDEIRASVRERRRAPPEDREAHALEEPVARVFRKPRALEHLEEKLQVADAAAALGDVDPRRQPMPPSLNASPPRSSPASRASRPAGPVRERVPGDLGLRGNLAATTSQRKAEG